MATTTRVDQINSLMDAASAAAADSDFATAITKALAAQALIAGLPSQLTRSAGSGGGQQSMTWSGLAIQDFVKNCRIAYGAALGPQQQTLEFVEPTLL